jgi:hypothetical protein
VCTRSVARFGVPAPNGGGATLPRRVARRHAPLELRANLCAAGDPSTRPRSRVDTSDGPPRALMRCVAVCCWSVKERLRVDAEPVGSPGGGAYYSLSTRGGPEQAVSDGDRPSPLHSDRPAPGLVVRHRVMAPLLSRSGAATSLSPRSSNGRSRRWLNINLSLLETARYGLRGRTFEGLFRRSGWCAVDAGGCGPIRSA